MKTQSTKLQFGKSSITELNDLQSLGVNGGCQWSDSSGSTVDFPKLSVLKPIDPFNPNDDNFNTIF